MGRGVDSLRYSLDVLYFDFTGDVYGEYNPESGLYHGDAYNQAESSENWDEAKANLINRLQELFPSLQPPCRNKWQGECQIALENELVYVAIAEYCGCVSLSIAARGETEWEYDASIPLAERWTASVYKRLRRNLRGLLFLDLMCKVGTFSNGESVFEKCV